MEGVAVVVDGEGFVGCVRGLRDALAGLPVVVGLLPSSRAAHGVVARGYDVFGQGAFGDMVALSCTVSPGAGAARAEAMRFLDGVISVVGKSGMVGWLFRVLWRADGSLLDAYGRVAEGRMPLPGEESADELEGYVDADHVIEAYRYFLDHADGDADGDGELDNGNPWRRPDFVQDKLLTLAGAGIVEPLVSTALEQGEPVRSSFLHGRTRHRASRCR